MHYPIETIQPRRFFTLSLGSFLGASLFLTSCCCTSPPSGQIYLDHPEVFTRERLVNRRLADLQWLEKELDRPITSTLQGGREQRSFTGFSAQLEAQFDPLGAAGALNAFGASQAMSQSTQKVAQLQNDLVATALQQELKDLQSGKISYKDILGTNPVSTVGSSANSASFSPSNSAISLPSFFSNPSNLPALPSASNLVFVSDRVQLTAIEQFRDRLAYRDAVAATMREKELDDTHDHAGMTLYTLKFDLSVLPGENNSSLGRAAATITAPSPKSDTDATHYALWVDSFRRTFDTEIISIQRRFLQNYLSDEEFRRLAVICWIIEEESVRSLKERYVGFGIATNTAELRQHLESKLNSGNLKSHEMALAEADLKHLAALDDYRALRNARTGAMSPEIRKATLRALCEILKFRFSVALSNASVVPLVCFGTPTEVRSYGPDSEGFGYLVPVETNGPDAILAFSHIQRKLATNAQPFIYTVEPKESAQNLSDVSARETVKNISLALAAAVPQFGAKGSAYVNYLKRQQYLLETIKRSPSLVGYIQNQTNFGWIVGPRFKIGKNLELDFEQAPRQESVQATIAVPAWWPALTINTTNEWLDAQAKSFTNVSTNLISHGQYDVRLRPDFDALTRALLEKYDPTFFNSPQIHPRWDSDERKRGYVLRANQPAQLLILGRNLWRNPEIFVGSQGTRKYEVLPDMAGLLATFDEIQPLQSLDTRDDVIPTADLRVVTSDGETVLKNAISVVPSRMPSQQPPFVKLGEPWGVAGLAKTFEVDTNLAPRSYNSFLLTFESLGADPIPVATNVEPNVLSQANLSFTLPARTTPEKTIINVKLKASPASSPAGVLQGGSQPFVLFINATQAQFRVESPALIISTNPAVKSTNYSLKLTLPDSSLESLFWDAHPGLKQALESSPAQLKLSNDLAFVLSKPAAFDKTSRTATFEFEYDPLAGKFSLKSDGAIADCKPYLMIPADSPRSPAAVAGQVNVKRKDSN